MSNRAQKFWESLGRYPNEVTSANIIDHVAKNYGGTCLQLSGLNPTQIAIMGMQTIADEYDCCYVQNYVNPNLNDQIDSKYGDFIFDIIMVDDVITTNKINYTSLGEYTYDNPLCVYDNPISLKVISTQVRFKSVCLSTQKHVELVRLLEN